MNRRILPDRNLTNYERTKRYRARKKRTAAGLRYALHILSLAVRASWRTPHA